MSKCISSHGEYSDHVNDEFHTCKWCGVFDEAEVLARLEAALAKIARVEALHEAYEDEGKSFCQECTAFGYLIEHPCPTIAALGLTDEEAS